MPVYFSQGRGTRPIVGRLASKEPKTHACRHGSAWTNGKGDGAAKVWMGLADAIGAEVTEIPMTPWRVLAALSSSPRHAV